MLPSSSSSIDPTVKSEIEKEKSEEDGKESENAQLVEGEAVSDSVKSVTENKSNDTGPELPSPKSEIDIEKAGGYGRESGHAELVKRQILSDGQKPLKSLAENITYGTGPRTTSQTSSSCSSSCSSPSPEPSPVLKRKLSADHSERARQNRPSKSSERNTLSSCHGHHSKSSVHRKSRSGHDQQSQSSGRKRSSRQSHNSKSSDRRRRSPHQSTKSKSSDRTRSSSNRNAHHRSLPRSSRTHQSHSHSRRSRSRHSSSRISNSRRRQSRSPDGLHSFKGHSSSHRESSRYSHKDSQLSRSYRHESPSSRGRRRSRSNERDRERRRRSVSRSSNRRYQPERDYIPPDSSHSSLTHRDLYANTAMERRLDYFTMERPVPRQRSLSELRRNWEDYHGVYVKPQSQEIENQEYWGECSSTTTLANDTSYSTMRIADCTDSGARQSHVVNSNYHTRTNTHSESKNVSPDTTSAGVQDSVLNYSRETAHPSSTSELPPVEIPRSSRASSGHEEESGAISDTTNSSSSESSSSSSGRKKKKSKKTKKKKRDESTKSHKSSRSEKETKKSKKRSAREARRNERLKRQKSEAVQQLPIQTTASPTKASSKELAKPKQKPAAVDDTMVTEMRKSLKPMSYEEYQKQQSVIRHVFDPESGRKRLVRGDGEILEEIVSRSRHQQINRAATAADGASFQATLASKK